MNKDNIGMGVLFAASYDTVFPDPSVVGLIRAWDSGTYWPTAGSADAAHLNTYLNRLTSGGRSYKVLLCIGKRGTHSYSQADVEAVARNIVSQFGSRIEAVEIINEPNTAVLSITPQQVAQMCQWAYPILHAAGITVAAPCPQGSKGNLYMEQFIQAKGHNYCDVLSAHMYANTPSTDMAVYANKYITLRAKYGLQSKPLWHTEFNIFGPGSVTGSAAKAWVKYAFKAIYDAGFQRNYWYAWDIDRSGSTLQIEPLLNSNRSALNSTGTAVMQGLSELITGLPVPVPGTPYVVLEPTDPYIVNSTQQQFTADVRNEGAPAVTWLVDGVPGGNSTVGTITSSGLYTAPGTDGDHIIEAKVTADPTVFASTTVHVGSSQAPPPVPPGGPDVPAPIQPIDSAAFIAANAELAKAPIYVLELLGVPEVPPTPPTPPTPPSVASTTLLRHTQFNNSGNDSDDVNHLVNNTAVIDSDGITYVVASDNATGNGGTTGEVHKFDSAGNYLGVLGVFYRSPYQMKIWDHPTYGRWLVGWGGGIAGGALQAMAINATNRDGAPLSAGTTSAAGCSGGDPRLFTMYAGLSSGGNQADWDVDSARGYIWELNSAFYPSGGSIPGQTDLVAVVLGYDCPSADLPTLSFTDLNLYSKFGWGGAGGIRVLSDGQLMVGVSAAGLGQPLDTVAKITPVMTPSLTDATLGDSSTAVEPTNWSNLGGDQKWVVRLGDLTSFKMYDSTDLSLVQTVASSDYGSFGSVAQWWYDDANNLLWLSFNAGGGDVIDLLHPDAGGRGPMLDPATHSGDGLAQVFYVTAAPNGAFAVSTAIVNAFAGYGYIDFWLGASEVESPGIPGTSGSPGRYVGVLFSNRDITVPNFVVLPWIFSIDDYQVNISDLDGSSDQGELHVTVQDRGRWITHSFNRFVYEGVEARLKTGFPGMDYADFPTLFVGAVDHVDGAEGNNCYTFVCLDNRGVLQKPIYETASDKTPVSLLGHPLDILLSILINQLGIDPTHVNQPKILDYRDGVLAGIEFKFSLTSVPVAKDFIEQEILKPLGAYLWVNHIGVFDVNFFYPSDIDSKLTLDRAMMFDRPVPTQSDLINEVIFRFDYDANDKPLAEDTENYQKSIDKYGLFGTHIIESRGMRSGLQGFTVAQLIARLIFIRYGLKTLQFEAGARWNACFLEPGNIANVTNPFIPDRANGVMGLTDHPFEVIGYTYNFKAGIVTLKMLDASGLSVFKKYFITPDGEANYAADTAPNKAHYMYLSSPEDTYTNGDKGNTLA